MSINCAFHCLAIQNLSVLTNSHSGDVMAYEKKFIYFVLVDVIYNNLVMTLCG